MPLTLSPDRIGFDPAPAPGEKSTFQLPFEEQIRFFRQKLNLPTAHWDDILKSAHDRAFVVAGAMKADLLNDLRTAVQAAVNEGKSLQWFRQNFRQIVAKNGWSGWTGEETAKGRAWRTRVIYATNLSTSYAAGRYAQLKDPDLLASRPYWKYVHNDSVSHPRPLHQAWGAKPVVLRHDDAWWNGHFPPNGWGCRCRVTAVRAGEYQGDGAPDDGTYTKVDRYGVTHTLPKGVDYGWDYAPGAGVDTPLRQMVQDKMIRWPPAITRALSRDVNRYINAHDDVTGFVRRALADRNLVETKWLGFVENPEPIRNAIDVDPAGYFVLLPTDAIHHVEKHHEFDGGDQRPAQPEDYGRIWSILADGEIIRGMDADNGLKRIVARLLVGDEWFRAIFEARPGRRNRAMALVTLAIKKK